MSDKLTEQDFYVVMGVLTFIATATNDTRLLQVMFCFAVACALARITLNAIGM